MLFIITYICAGGAFLLTLKAPGIPTLEERAQFAYGRLNDAESGNVGPTSASEGSTFRNIWAKTKLVGPYLWPPRGHYRLQFYVFICFMMLILGRVTNLFVPLYNKWIVDGLTYDKKEPEASLTFRWDLILIYVALRFFQGKKKYFVENFLINEKFYKIWIKFFSSMIKKMELFCAIKSLCGWAKKNRVTY